MRRGTTYADDNERQFAAAGEQWMRDNLPQQVNDAPRETGSDGALLRVPDSRNRRAMVATTDTNPTGPMTSSPIGLAPAADQAADARGFGFNVSTFSPGDAALAAQREQRAGAINADIRKMQMGLMDKGDITHYTTGPGANGPAQAVGFGQSGGYGLFDANRLRERELSMAASSSRTGLESSKAYDQRIAGAVRNLGDFQNGMQQTGINDANNAAALVRERMQTDTTRRGQDVEFGFRSAANRNQLDVANLQGTAQRDVARINADGRVDAADARAEAQRIALSAGHQGTPSGYRWNGDGTLSAIPGGPADQNSKANAPLNEGQSKSLGFGTRMLQSGKLLDDLAVSGVHGPSFAQQMTSGRGMLGTAANALASPAQQQAAQAQRDFINSVLRRESGAAIADTEFENASRQYFAQPGDSEQVLGQKRRNRETATRAILADVPNADGRVRSILGDDFELADWANPPEPDELAELRRRARSNPQLAERLRKMGY